MANIVGTIRPIQDKDGNYVFPETCSEAVIMKSGKTLDESLDGSLFLGEEDAFVEIQEPGYINKLNNVINNTNGFVSVLSFKNDNGDFIKGDGITDDTTGLQRALDSGFRLIFPKNKVFGVTELIIKNSMELDLNGCTIKRISESNSLIYNLGTIDFTLKNGVIDGQNIGGNYGHLLNINDMNSNIKVINVTFKNNCKGYPAIIKSVDSDLVYIQNANNVFIDNCRFELASRQGVSLTNRCSTLIIKNSFFKDCYLFAFDFEPNVANDFLCENFTFENNIVLNCGQKSSTDSVWNSGGFMAIACPKDTSRIIVRNLKIKSNVIKNESFLVASSGLIAPYCNISQYTNLTLEDNYFLNYSRIIIGQYENETQHTKINNNFITSNASIGSNVYLQANNSVSISNNRFDCTFNQIKKANTVTVDNNNFYKDDTRLVDIKYLIDKIGIYPIKNKISNGIFNDLTNWSFGTTVTDKTVSNNWLVVQGGGNLAGNKNRWIYQANVITNLGHKYYIGAIFKSHTSTPVFCSIGNGYNQRSYIDGLTNNTLISSVFTADNIDGDNTSLTIGTDSNTKSMVTNVIVLDLTEIFGAGNEPSKIQVDYLISCSNYKTFHN